ncbi:MAG: HIT family protein [Bacteroidetes bacterium]|nr:HIT family protein [Bacteroidota bacterium]
MSDCPFCDLNHRTIIAETNEAIAFYDGFPVSPGHILVIPRRHCSDFFQLSPSEQNACLELLNECQKQLISERNPDGFNIGINVGTAAGQTIFHAHLHLIPRYAGDVENPRGGVRGVIPAKKDY